MAHPRALVSRRSLLAAALFLALLALPRVAAAQGGPPPAAVLFDAARQEVLEERRQVVGELRARRRSLLASEEEGLVVSVEIEDGQAIAKDAVLVKLRDTAAELDVVQAKARTEAQAGLVHQRQAELKKAESDLGRKRALLERRSASQADVDDAEAEVAAAAARLEQAKAEVRSAEADERRAAKRLRDMTIRAPFDARVLGHSAEVGQWVRKGDPVAEVLDLSEIEVWLDVPERWIGGVGHDGAEILVRVPSVGVEATLTQAQVMPAGDRVSRLFPVRLRMDNSSRTLLPGMSAVGSIPTGERRDVLTVHKDAVLRDDAGEFVYFKGPSGIAQVARIDVLFASGPRVAVSSRALEAGAMVVVEGNERLFPGRPLVGGPRPSE